MATLLEKLENKEPVVVLITGACGQIAYNLIFLVARGDLLGPDQPVVLHLLDIPPLEPKLEAVVMELEDIASPVLTRIVATSSYEAAFAGVDIAMLVGARPRGPGMERSDLLAANAAIFRGQGDALNRLASRDVKVVVVGNPANTNALIAARAAPSLPRTAFSALTRLDQNRAAAMLARRLGVQVRLVKTVIIWGNHSTTQFPDARFATVADLPRPGDSTSAPSLLGPDGAAWLRDGFVHDVQNRGKAVIDKRGASSAASAAEAIVAHVRDWVLGSDGYVVSMGVWCDGSAFGVGDAEGLIFSVPVITKRGGSYAIVSDLTVDAFARGKLAETEAELKSERALAFAPPAPAQAPAAAALPSASL